MAKIGWYQLGNTGNSEVISKVRAASGITRTSEATNCTDISDSQGDLS